MDDDDYGIDEVMYNLSIVLLTLLTIAFLSAVAGFIWAMI